MKTSTAWQKIGVAFLKKAVEPTALTSKEQAITHDGLCYARLEVGVSSSQHIEMYEAIQGVMPEGQCYLSLRFGPEESNDRAALALIFAAEARSNEARFKTTAGAFFLAGAL